MPAKASLSGPAAEDVSKAASTWALRQNKLRWVLYYDHRKEQNGIVLLHVILIDVYASLLVRACEVLSDRHREASSVCKNKA